MSEFKSQTNLNNHCFKNIILLNIILSFALVLRLYNLDRYSFWYDEATTLLDKWGLTHLPSFSKLFDPTYLTQNCDYLRLLYSRGIIYFWTELFGRTEFIARLPSVIFGIFGIYALYRFTKQFFGIQTAWIVSLFLTLSSFHIYYSQELRPYTLVSITTIICLYVFLKALETDKNKYWIYYIIVNILNIYILYTDILLLLSFIVFFIIKINRYRHILKPFIVVHMVIALLLMPIFLTLYPNLKFMFNNKIMPAFSEFPIWIPEKISFKHLIFTFKNFSIGYNTDFFSFTGWFTTLLYFVLFLIGLFKSYKNLYVQLILSCLFTPILLVFFLSQIKHCYVYRYFFPIFPLYLLIVGIGLNKINRKVILILTIAFIIGLNCLGLRSYYSNQLPKDRNQFVGIGEKQDIRSLVKVILENFKNGDRIMHISKNTVFPLKFYIRQGYGSQDLIHEVDKGTVIFIYDSYGKGKMLAINYDKLHPTSFLPQEYSIIDKEVSESKRLWLIFSDFIFPTLNSQAYEVIKRLKNRFKEIKLYKFTGAYLYLFSKNKN